jgi:4-amino-4-deoxyprephenate dehydrogenase
MEKKVTILGINGSFGSLFSRLLYQEDRLTITGIDLNSEAHISSKCSKYIQVDLRIFIENLILVLSESGLIIICLPEDIAYQFLKLYEHYISKTALLIDTLSVKKEVASFYEKNHFNALSLNPMFGPDLQMEGKNIIVVKFKETTASNWFISLLETWKLNIVYATSDEHDKMSSIVQVATHAAIMAFGATLNESDISISELLKVATPPFLSISALFGRIVSGNKKVYWNIQNENTYASEVRKKLIKNLIALDKSIDNNREGDFNNLIEPKTPDQKEAFKKLSDHFSSMFKENKSK